MLRACRTRGRIMAEHRRGIVSSEWQKLWHFNEACPSYPTRRLRVAGAKPPDDDLLFSLSNVEWFCSGQEANSLGGNPTSTQSSVDHSIKRRRRNSAGKGTARIAV